MSDAYDQLINMIEVVARALGDEMLNKVAFVGGCTTVLLVTDDLSKEEVRFTDDIDLIINVVGYAKWVAFQEQLRNRGFTESMEDDVICRMRLGELKVDFMPDDKDILGFSNRWYKGALESAENYLLKDDLTIKLITPPFFIATKLEAYLGRGGEDLLGSHDIEDVLYLIDGREELITEIKNIDRDVRCFIIEQITNLLANNYIEYAVQGFVRGNKGRENLIFERLETIKAI